MSIKSRDDQLRYMPSTIPDLQNPDSQSYKKARRQYYKATKNRPANSDFDWSPFRAAEKRYKARFPLPDLSSVLDLALLDTARQQEIEQGVWRGSPNAVYCTQLPPKTAVSTQAYFIPSLPGLVILPSFVSPEKQRQLARWSLIKQARHPNETNLDTHYALPVDGLWKSWLLARDDCNKDILVRPKASDSQNTELLKPGPRQMVNNTPASLDNFQTLSLTPKPPQAPSPTIQPSLSSSLLYKLRWANIGWYYHWGTKQYDFSKGKGVIDTELRDVCISAVAAVDWDQVFAGTEAEWGEAGPEWKSWDKSYEPDAGIVNFYQTKDTLMAHVDRSEVCATSPLVSISLGNAAIFLVGGLTRDGEPVPILLRSGDVIIMSGPTCRRAYHGVPRILEETLPPHLKTAALDEQDRLDWQAYEDYLCTTRININVRQVFPKGFEPPL